MQHGISDASTLGFALLGFISGPVFHRYGEGYQFAKLACDPAEKHGFIANQPKVYHATGTVSFWTQPTGAAIDFMRTTFRSATETGDLSFACYGLYQIVTGLLLRNDPLDAVWLESEKSLDFARKAGFRDMADASFKFAQSPLTRPSGSTRRQRVLTGLEDANVSAVGFEPPRCSTALEPRDESLPCVLSPQKVLPGGAVT